MKKYIRSIFLVPVAAVISGVFMMPGIKADYKKFDQLKYGDRVIGIHHENLGRTGTVISKHDRLPRCTARIKWDDGMQDSGLFSNDEWTLNSIKIQGES